MKKLIFLILIMSSLMSCSKTTDDFSKDQILGEWIWLESSGGLAGTTESPESRQQVVKLVISENSIKKFIDDNLESERRYSMARRESMIYGDHREMIIYDNGFRQMFFVSGNELILTGDCNDCMQSRYRKK